LAVGLLLVSQALGRVQTATASTAVKAQASSSARTIATNTRLVKTLLNKENAFLVKGQRLLAQQNAINIRITALAGLPSTPRIRALIACGLAKFNKLQGMINRNNIQAQRFFAFANPQIQRALTNLSAFSSNPGVAAFIQASAARQRALEQQLQNLINTPPATPFQPV